MAATRGPLGSRSRPRRRRLSASQLERRHRSSGAGGVPRHRDLHLVAAQQPWLRHPIAASISPSRCPRGQSGRDGDQRRGAVHNGTAVRGAIGPTFTEQYSRSAQPEGIALRILSIPSIVLAVAIRPAAATLVIVSLLRREWIGGAVLDSSCCCSCSAPCRSPPGANTRACAARAAGRVVQRQGDHRFGPNEPGHRPARGAGTLGLESVPARVRAILGGVTAVAPFGACRSGHGPRLSGRARHAATGGAINRGGVLFADCSRPYPTSLPRCRSRPCAARCRWGPAVRARISPSGGRRDCRRARRDVPDSVCVRRAVHQGLRLPPGGCTLPIVAVAGVWLVADTPFTVSVAATMVAGAILTAAAYLIYTSTTC